ncbi:ATP-binding protein [Amycolatopsis nigrescens]|uniref:ATP-binding protein n=1 Tax=Amycolatopsis nigrescens TaxID=381445 RepID=UPI000371698B|nr:helix-turn-helix domain-containing protein [Amycolatopsis nigrescens]
MADGGSDLPLFAYLLARHRRAAGLTQEELAEKSGISTRSISDMERGRVRRPQHRTLRALTTALALDEPDLADFLRTGSERAGPVEEPAVEVEPPAGDRPLRELPPAVTDLTGRERELDVVTGLVDAGRQDTGAATVISLYGPPGVGKTTFAVHAGHRLAERYPDGCLFVNLRGMDHDRLTAEQALSRLLIALGVSETQLPSGIEQRSGLYRSLLQDRKMLLLLDNVADEAQVRPLLPSSPGCLVLVTSRRVLSGLESVARVPLEVLHPAESVRLLASIIGQNRVIGEPDAAERVTELCGHLPLALRIAGNRLATRPRWRIAHLVAQLDDQQRRLTALTAGDLQVRAAFEVSYRQFDEWTRAVFRRLSLIAGPDVTAELAAVLVEAGVERTETAMEELVDASLLDATMDDGSYVLHDLLKLFASERLAVEERAAEIRAAEDRMAGWVLRAGTRAGLVLSPPGSGPASAPAAGDVAAADRAAAVHWLDAEKPRWLAAIRHGARTGAHADVLDFSRAMHWYSEIRSDGQLWREVFGYGVEAARALGRRQDEAVQLNFLGWALTTIHGMHREALHAHENAWRAARETGDRNEEAWALQYCGRTELVQGKAAEAEEYIRPAIALFHELDDLLGKHIALSILGLALHQLERYEEAIDAHRRTVEFFRTPDLKPHENLLATALLRLGDAVLAGGDPADALRTYQESLALATKADHPFVEGLALFGCGRCSQETGDDVQAWQQYNTALRILTEIGESWHQVRVLHRMALLDDRLDSGRAMATRARALKICVQLNTAESTRLAERLSTELANTTAPQRRTG